MLLLNDWIGELLQAKGNDIYRMKGVLAVSGSKQKFVYQGVHMLFDGEFEGEWEDDEPRGCKLVFIGKNLDKAELEGDFNACLDTPENAARVREASKVMIAERNERALLGAAQRDDVRAIRGLLESGADVNKANAMLQTPLHIAALWGNGKAVEVLLEHGANPNAVNDLGEQTPLHMLASTYRKGNDDSTRVPCGKALLKAGADPTKVNGEGIAPYEMLKGETEPDTVALRDLLTPK